MRLKILVLITFGAFSAALQARPLIDSVGVENQNGKKIILHKLEAKETYYAIARKYNVKPQAVIQFNNNVALHPGDIIKVPTDRPFLQAATQAQPQTNAAVEGGTVIQYKVAQHEYLFGIAKRFGTTVEDIKKLNNLKSDVLAPGQIISIHQGAGTQPQVAAEQPPVKQAPVQVQPKPLMIAPPANTQVQPPVSAVNTGETGTVIQYKVTKREYLYSVAKRFNTTVESIKQLNNLTENGLKPGMVLNIRQGEAPANTIVVQQANRATDTIPPAKRDTTNIASIADSLNNKHATSRYGLFEKNEKGIATWMDDPSFDPNKKLILHRTAPIGTVVKITNPMTSRTTFAKVVGRFTDNESTRDVIIVMTKNVAESLGAIDKRFRVNISYGVPNE